jgi:outer membrane lipoprotein SlyB
LSVFFNPDTEHEINQAALTGALIGGVLGAGIGAGIGASSHRWVLLYRRW